MTVVFFRLYLHEGRSEYFLGSKYPAAMSYQGTVDWYWQSRKHAPYAYRSASGFARTPLYVSSRRYIRPLR